MYLYSQRARERERERGTRGSETAWFGHVWLLYVYLHLEFGCAL